MALAVHRVAAVLARQLSIIVAVVLGAGCYSPSLRDCTVTCAAASDCGGGQICGADGYCAAPSVAGRCTSTDAAVAGADAMVVGPDATSLCELGCTNGTCNSGICEIDCSAPGSCPGVVACPPNLPCRVTCGDGACSNHVECRLATTCEVVCSGTGSCSDEIRCGDAPCKVTCSGENACGRIKCKNACSCDAVCSGEDSCAETTECPVGDACRLGEGCSSELAGCDRCP